MDRSFRGGGASRAPSSIRLPSIVWLDGRYQLQSLAKRRHRVSKALFLPPMEEHLAQPHLGTLLADAEAFCNHCPVLPVRPDRIEELHIASSVPAALSIELDSREFGRSLLTWDTKQLVRMSVANAYANLT